MCFILSGCETPFSSARVDSETLCFTLSSPQLQPGKQEAGLRVFSTWNLQGLSAVEAYRADSSESPNWTTEPEGGTAALSRG